MRPPPEELRTANKELFDWLNELLTYVMENKVFYISQNAQPTISKNSVCLWKDADGGPKWYLVCDLDGTAKKVEVT